jgi:hypothetical protein
LGILPLGLTGRHKTFVFERRNFAVCIKETTTSVVMATTAEVRLYNIEFFIDLILKISKRDGTL